MTHAVLQIALCALTAEAAYWLGRLQGQAAPRLLRASVGVDEEAWQRTWMQGFDEGKRAYKSWLAARPAVTVMARGAGGLFEKRVGREAG